MPGILETGAKTIDSPLLNPVIFSSLVAVATTIITLIVNGFLNRRKSVSEADKTDAEAADTIVKMATAAAQDLVSSYKQQVDDLRTQVNLQNEQMAELRKELQLQAEAIDNTNAEVLKLNRLIKKFSYLVTCLVNQIIRLGEKPIATLDDLDRYSVEEWAKLAKK